ncbi:RNA polymerase sigma factor [Paraburkholderia rhizosphaerae]|uniref:RNA polymerase sigma-70 factor (ECF subfamily) n=1 Tax=Paraburkholderia rhizosphaerae TaxID=480658 RepID=A0A4R8LZC5_9BURK|nr:sigma factor-like helix-turn-helix DNA-binding protein [Paraburkholderia rhizosphaerae]TDY53422.1 RNA polymerase sigma-70 factor (ECF subfamily) [Paraburkholderia rhizosphaerae]
MVNQDTLTGIESLPRIWAFALRLTEQERDAERLVVQACRRFTTGDWSRSASRCLGPMHRLFSIMAAVWLEEGYAQRHARLRPLKGDCTCDGSCEQLATSCAHCLLRHAVSSLPDAQRVPMLLVLVEGLSYAEAGDVLAMSKNEVADVVAQGRATVAGALSKHRQYGVAWQSELC